MNQDDRIKLNDAYRNSVDSIIALLKLAELDGAEERVYNRLRAIRSLIDDIVPTIEVGEE